jgi:hypothetical protein
MTVCTYATDTRTSEIRHALLRVLATETRWPWLYYRLEDAQEVLLLRHPGEVLAEVVRGDDLAHGTVTPGWSGPEIRLWGLDDSVPVPPPAASWIWGAP